jgi:hypothetical protein
LTLESAAALGGKVIGCAGYPRCYSPNIFTKYQFYAVKYFILIFE